jgi:hypothetical protein
MLAALPLVNEEQATGTGEPQRRSAAEEEAESLPAAVPTEEGKLPQSKIPTVPPTARKRRGVSPIVVTFAAVFTLVFLLAFFFSWR